MRGKTGTTPRRFICPSSAICRSLLCLLFVLVTGSSSDNPELEYQLAVLRAVDGVTGVSIFGVEGRDKQHGINLYLCVSPDEPRTRIREACAQHKPTKLQAALVARQRVAAALGSAALEAAEDPGNSSCARMLTICGESVASEMWVVESKSAVFQDTVIHREKQRKSQF